MQILLTDIAIQKLVFKDKTASYFDANMPGFGIRVGKRRKTFFTVVGKSRSPITIGHYPEISLKDARNRAKAILVQGASKTPLRSNLSATEAFLRDSEKRLGRETVRQYERYLKHLDIDLNNLTRAHITERLAKYDDKPHSQNYAHATLRNFLNWCVQHEFIESHPLIRSRTPNKLRSRDRVLTDEELARVWRCTDDDVYGRIIRLLMLTGQRRMEVRNLKPEDVTDVLTFHTKGSRINILPITPLVRENLILPFKFNNWATAKARFDTDCQVDFRHHDLRRTLATKLAGMGASVVIVERILGHTIGGVAGIYNRYSYLKEVEEALLLYEAHIKKIVGLA